MRRMNKTAAWLLSTVLFLSTMTPVTWAVEEDAAPVKEQQMAVSGEEISSEQQTVGEDGMIISISTAEELVQLSGNCSLDSWSQGKTIRLEKDIDLTGVDYQPIPTFGGIFEGQGHTISGLSVTGSGNTRGLFRYIQPSGKVLDLTVEGRIEPTDRKNSIGGIVGENKGTLANCTFIGEITGKNNVGGLVGVNQAEGQIINCKFRGGVKGEHYVGGIAGQNLGSIIQCENLGNINTVEIDVTVDQEDMNHDQFNAAENTPVCTDIGGITGFSSGILQNCHNSGEVGYEHVGYNIGGIAGRQTGYLDGCSNQGMIRGRKDVGGIAGQMEPELLLKYNEGNMGKLLDELDVLQGLMDQTTNHLSQTSQNTSNQMQSISDKAQEAQNLLTDLADSGTDWLNDNLESIDDVSSRISWTLEHLLSVVNTGGDVMYQMKELFKEFKELIDEIDLAAEFGTEAAADLRAALEEFQEASERGKESLSHLKKAMEHLKNVLGRSAETAEAWEEIAAAVSEMRQSFDDMSEALSRISGILSETESENQEQWQVMAGEAENIQNAHAEISEGLSQVEQAVLGVAEVFRQADGSSTYVNLGELEAAYQELKAANDSLVQAVHSLGEALKGGIEALKDLEAAGGQLGNVGEKLKDICDQMSHISFLMSDMGDDLSGVVEGLVDQPTIRIYPINETMQDQQDALGDVLSSLLDDGEALHHVISDGSDLLIDDMKAINDQFGVITQTLRDIINDPEDESEKDYFEDVSDQETGDQDTGYISNSENNGQIEGDINVAGIVGSMAVEYDFDPEDDLKKSGDRSPDFRYQAKAIVSGCINHGEVTGKKDYMGGITGRMDLGRVSSCENYGTVTGTSGNYVGGIAGASWGSIHDSWAKCWLSGTDYIGGIAGYGSTIRNCHTLVEVEDGSAYIGAVAGWINEEGTLEQNTFTSKTLAALDGVSYAGMAEPVAFETLCSTEGVPSGFSDLKLTFTADGETVAVIPFEYAGSLETLPEIPEKAGYSATWPAIDYQCLTASQTLEAEYTPYASALSDDSKLPEILVDGSFGSQAEISHKMGEASWTDEDGVSHDGIACTVMIEDPAASGEPYTIHYRLPDKKKSYTLWIKTGEEQWTKREHTVDGQYLMFEEPSSEVTFCVLETGSWIKWLAAAFSGVVVVAGFGIFLYHRKKRHTVKGEK